MDGVDEASFPCGLLTEVSSRCRRIDCRKTSRRRTSSYFKKTPATKKKATGNASKRRAKTSALAKKRRRQPKRLQKTSPYFNAALKQAEEDTAEKRSEPVPQLQAEEDTNTNQAGEEQEQEMPAHKDTDGYEGTEERPVTVSSGSTGSTCVVKRHRHLLYPHFSPPQSPFGLVQEQLYNEPWKLLVATIFLNKTTGLAAKPILWEFLRLYQSPAAAVRASAKELALLFQPLGLHRKRAKGIIRFSEEYLEKDWEYPMELHGIGKYGNDSYRIFCTEEWKEVRPTDHWLNKYYAWLCQLHQYQPTNWTP